MATISLTYWSAIVAALGAMGALFASIVQNTVFAIKARNEIKRQAKLDRWTRRGTEDKLKHMEGDLQEAHKRITTLESDLQQALVREKANNILLERMIAGQIKVVDRVTEIERKNNSSN